MIAMWLHERLRKHRCYWALGEFEIEMLCFSCGWRKRRRTV